VLTAPLPPPQLAYQAWVTNTRTALRQQEQLEPPGAEVAAGGSGSPQNGAGGGRERGQGPAPCPLFASCNGASPQRGSQRVCGLSDGYDGVGHEPCGSPLAPTRVFKQGGGRGDEQETPNGGQK